MSAKLIVHNIPPTMALDEFTTQFKVFKGFNNANFLCADENGQYIAQIDFLNFEFADHAKKVMQNYVFPNHQHQSGLAIDFLKQENTYENFNQNPIHPTENMNFNTNQNYYNPDGGEVDSKILYPLFKKMRLSYENQEFQNVQNPNYIIKPSIMNPPQNFISNQSQSIEYYLKMKTNFIVDDYPDSNPSTLPNQNMIPAMMPAFPEKTNFLPPFPGPQPASNNNSIALFKIPQNATNSLYVDGVPFDSNDREVAHIFRPFPGFQSVRLIPKKTKSGREFYLCFVDFENSLQSTIALNTLQDYRFNKKDKKGMKISYASEPRERKKK